MSFDIFLQCFRNGEPEPIPREIFEPIFGPHDTHPHLRAKDPGYMVVEYPDGSGGCIYSGYDKEDPEHWSHMMFNHCGGEAFFADMYELARRTRSVIFWPDPESIYVYTDETVPAELRGMPFFEEARSVLVHSGAEIIKAIETS